VPRDLDHRKNKQKKLYHRTREIKDAVIKKTADGTRRGQKGKGSTWRENEIPPAAVKKIN